MNNRTQLAAETVSRYLLGGSKARRTPVCQQGKSNTRSQISASNRGISTNSFEFNRGVKPPSPRETVKQLSNPTIHPDSCFQCRRLLVPREILGLG